MNMRTLTCQNHNHLRWLTKEIAVNEDGRWNGQRHVHFQGNANGQYEPECSCPGKELIALPE
jgi:hypothetical protein